MRGQRSGLIPSERSRRAQCAECDRGHRGRRWNWTSSRIAFAKALASFTGVDRRFQMRGEERGVTVIDDYGHHPTEIRATLAAARAVRLTGAFTCCSSRIATRARRHLMDEFARAFIRPTHVYVLDIYAASEEPIEGVTAQALAERMREFGHRGVAVCRNHRAGRRGRRCEACATRRRGADAGRRQCLAGGRSHSGTTAGGAPDGRRSRCRPKSRTGARRSSRDSLRYVICACRRACCWLARSTPRSSSNSF